MLKKLTSVAFLALALLSSASAAHAKPKVERAQLNIATSGRIIVVADDGENYSRLATQNLRFEGNVDVKMKSGKLLGYGIYFGVCADSLCGSSAFKQLHSNSFSKRKEIKENVSFELSTDQIPQGLSSNVQASGLFKVCQEKAQGQSVDTDISHFLKMTLALDFKEQGTNIADWADDRDIQVRVICRALQQIKAPPKPFSVDVQVEQKGETCPKQTDVRAIIKYKVPATARFRFKVDGKLSKLHEIKARKIEPYKPHPGPGPGGYYLVERLKTYHLDPGQTHFRIVMEDGSGKKSAVKTVRIDCPPFEVTSAWLKYEVEKKLTCPKKVVETATFKATRPGKAPFEIKHQGGLVAHSGKATFERKGMEYVAKVKRNLSMNAFDADMMADITNGPANSGWVRLQVPCMEVLSGTLDLRGFEAARCEGEAAFSTRTNMPGKVPYQLDCTGGRSWKGKVEAHQTGPNTYIGVGVKRFDVSNNEQVNCALKTAKPLPHKALALKGRNYECHKTTGVSGTNDLAPDPGRPDDDLPQGGTLKGDFGFVDHGSPKCPRQGKALLTFRSPKADNVHYSLDCKFFSKSGVTAVKPHPDGGYVGAALVSFDVDKTVDESCTLRTLAPYGPKEHVTKGRLFQCVTPTTPPATTDLTPETRPEPQGPRKPGNAIVIPPRVVIDPPREPKRPDRVVVDPPRTPSDSVPPSYPVPPGGKGGAAADVKVIDTGRGGKDSSAADATPDYPKKTRGDAEADRKRLEALKRKQAEEARKKAETERRRKAAEAAARAKREAAKKAAEARRKREAAKKAAELKRKREAAKKAAEARRRLEAAKKAAGARRKRGAAKRQRSRPPAVRRTAPAPMQLHRRR